MDRFTIALPPTEDIRHLQLVVTEKSPLKYRKMAERFALYFKREMHYDAPDYNHKEKGGYRIHLFFDTPNLRYVGACCFRWIEWTDSPHCWTMTWAWIHPYFRRRGILSAHWPTLRKEYGDFACLPPLSDAMQRFAIKHGYRQPAAEKDATGTQTGKGQETTMHEKNRQPKPTGSQPHGAHEQEWSAEFPGKEGTYWFYGDPYQGQMGADFRENTAEGKMYLVAVRKISNGFVATTDGQFIPTTQFDRTRQRNGYVGYWKKATLPKAPDDTLGLFAKT